MRHALSRSTKMQMLRQIEMEMVKIKSTQAAQERKHTEAEAHDETNQIEKFPVHLSLTYLRHALPCLGTQNVKQPFRQLRSFQDGIYQCQAAPRLLMLGQVQQRPAYQRIAAKTLRALDQPQIQLVFRVAHVGQQLGVEARRIVHQVSRVDFEKVGEQQPRLVS